MRLRFLAPSALLITAPGVILAEPADGTAAAAIPCRDERGCPDLTVDPARLLVGDQVTRRFAEDDCAVVEGAVEAGTRRLLRLTLNTPNHGDGDVVLGAPRHQPEWFTWSPCHGHYHFEDFAAYRPWTPEGFEAWQALRAAEPERTADELL